MFNLTFFGAIAALGLGYLLYRNQRSQQKFVHPPKADTSKCKYDQEVQRQTRFRKPDPVDFSNLPVTDDRVSKAHSNVLESRVVENLKKLTGVLPVTVGNNGNRAIRMFMRKNLANSLGLTGKIVTRSSYSKEIRELAAPWVEEQYDALGIKHSRHNYGKNSFNIVAEIPGDGSSKKVLIVGAHLDSTAGQTWRDERVAPGADDDASGTILLLELARAIKDWKLKYTVRLVHFTMEEQGLEGSYAYSDKVKREGTDLVGMLQFDMVGYHSVEGNRMDVHDGEDKNGSHSIYEAFARAAKQYNLDLTVFDTHNAEMNDRSDHAGFLHHGYKAVLVSEEFTDAAFNPYYHSEKDTVDKLNIPYYMEIIKLAIATVANLAELQ